LAFSLMSARGEQHTRRFLPMSEDMQRCAQRKKTAGRIGDACAQGCLDFNHFNHSSYIWGGTCVSGTLLTPCWVNCPCGYRQNQTNTATCRQRSHQTDTPVYSFNINNTKVSCNSGEPQKERRHTHQDGKTGEVSHTRWSRRPNAPLATYKLPP